MTEEIDIKAIRKRAQQLGVQTMIVIIQGALGSGKTLLMSYFGLNFIKKGIPVYSSYALRGSIPLDTIMRVRELGAAVVLVDDAIKEGLDSYGQMGQGSRLATRMLRFVRKKHLVIILTQQVSKGVALRVRHITNYVFETRQLRYPYFHVRGYMPNGYCWLDTGVKYEQGVTDAYNTDEVVEDKIERSRLEELYELSSVSKIGSNMQIFKYLVVSEYGIPLDLAGVVYHCVKDKNYAALEYLGDSWGYEVV